MKEFKTPECELIALDEEDVITASGTGCQGQNEGGGDCMLNQS